MLFRIAITNGNCNAGALKFDDGKRTRRCKVERVLYTFTRAMPTKTRYILTRFSDKQVCYPRVSV